MNERLHVYFVAPVLLVAGLLWLGLSAKQQTKPHGVPDDSLRQALLDKVKAPEGFEVTLFAAPPRVSYPTVITAGPTGTLFVGIDKNSSLDQKQGRGQVLRLVDTDGDGRADRITAFVEEVDSPRGLVYDGEWLYVMHPPRLTAYRDTDGDGRADESKVLVRGLGFDLDFRGADHTTNGMQMGIDGWLYIAVGDYGFQKAVGTDGRTVRHRGGGVVRVRPDGSGLELVATGLRNPYDLAIDPYLNLFVRGNTNDGGGWDVRLSHIIPLANYGYPNLFKHFGDEIMAPLADYGGGSGTGAYYLQGPSFPAPYSPALYTADWGRSNVYRHPLKPKGATFEAEQQVFLEIPRPTDMTTDGSGRFYVSSWYDGGYRYSGQDVGFIVRLTYPGREVPPFPTALSEANSDELLDLLASDSQVRRLYAQREILRRGHQPPLVHGVMELARGDAPRYARVAALFTLKQLLGADAHGALLTLTHDAEVRAFALRALADRKTQLENVPVEPFVQALEAEDARVQLEGLIGLARLGASQAADEILPLVASEDSALAHVAVQALVRLEAVEPALQALDGEAQAVAAGALRVLQQLHTSQTVEGLLTQLKQTQSTQRRWMILQALARLYYQQGEWEGEWWGTRPSTKGPYYELATWLASDRIAPVLEDALTQASGDGRAALISAYERNRVVPAGAQSLLMNLQALAPSSRKAVVEALVGAEQLQAETLPLIERLAVDHPDLRDEIVRFLVHQDEVPLESLPLLQEAALNERLDPDLRQQALDALRRIPEEGLAAVVETFAELSAVSNLPAPLDEAWLAFVKDRGHAQRMAYFTELAREGSAPERELAYAVLLNVAQTSGIDEATREQARTALKRAWNAPTTTAALLRAIGRMGAGTYVDQVRAHREASQEAVREAARYAARRLEAEARPGATGASGSSIADLSYEKVVTSVVEMPGDPKRGEQLFRRQGCMTCHTISQDAPLKGPYLGDIAARYNRRQLAESILRPSAQIAQGFHSYWFETEDGSRYTGFIVSESGGEIVIRNQFGTETVLDKSKVTDRGKRETSIMPRGLVNPLTVGELASLIAYLEALNAQTSAAK